ncbi:hypothetical protein H6A66_11160 [Bacteroides caecigallinarum]|uniref:hypothetical protein n=1 Tax=Bacteroides caecigallinarum TaxID=1411144 RepID=UPI00195CD2D2|nr:hypothetical protein [Bacteroides caecigallinarum]MBM6865722.1 hypothetical protein [Bacteroides caecigallinarum]
MANEKRHTCFLKVPDYQKKYLEMRYGSPVCFPQASMMQLYLRRYLVRNSTMKRITDLSCSSAAFNLTSSTPTIFTEYQPIKDDERAEFVEIEIPDEVMYGNKMVKVDKFFQPNPQGTRLLRKEIRNEFWMAFSQFRDECIFRAARINETVNTEDAMSDFMNIYDIDMRYFESLMRNWWRVKRKIKDGIDSRREDMEDKSGNVFLYT